MTDSDKACIMGVRKQPTHCDTRRQRSTPRSGGRTKHSAWERKAYLMKQQKDAENMTAAGNCTDKQTRIKSTGIIRRVDELGRIVIPMSIRQTLGLNERDPVEIFMDGERIILQKHQSSCIFCGSTEDLIAYEGKNVCAACREALSRNN